MRLPCNTFICQRRFILYTTNHQASMMADAIDLAAIQSIQQLLVLVEDGKLNTGRAGVYDQNNFFH